MFDICTGTLVFWVLLCTMFLLPMATAAPTSPMAKFPDIKFSLFNVFIQKTFGQDISLSAVLVLLFTLIENPELLSLHSRQQNPVFLNENQITMTGWIKSLSRAILHRFKNDASILFNEKDLPKQQSQQILELSHKLDRFIKFLGLSSYDKKKKTKRNLLPINQESIKPIYILCPINAECMDAHCEKRGLLQTTKVKDVPLVTLIKNNTVFEDTPVLVGGCTKCDTSYYADHERFKENGQWKECYLNSARYLKVGQQIWVDRNFSHGVLSGIYNFHASAAAYTQFYNNFVLSNSGISLSRRQIWQAFIQESIRLVALGSQMNLEVPEKLNIEELTSQAFNILGNNGIIQEGIQHSCSECTHKYKATPDIIPFSNTDPAAIVGQDEDEDVPRLIGQNIEQSTQEIIQSHHTAVLQNQQVNLNENIDYEPVKMIVMDGIVMGPTVSKNKWFKVNDLIKIYSIVLMMIVLMI